MLYKHKDMWSGRLGTIKGPPHLIDFKSGMRPIKQLPYQAGPQRRKLVDEHVYKMFAYEVIDPSQS